MALVRQTVEEYTALLSRAFNGAIEVDGTRIVAHPSGTLLARTPPTAGSARQGSWHGLSRLDPENDWSSV